MKYRFSPSPNIKNCGVPSGGATSLHLAQYFAQRNRGIQYGYGFPLCFCLLRCMSHPNCILSFYFETRASLTIHGLVAVFLQRDLIHIPRVFPARTGEASSVGNEAWIKKVLELQALEGGEILSPSAKDGLPDQLQTWGFNPGHFLV